MIATKEKTYIIYLKQPRKYILYQHLYKKCLGGFELKLHLMIMYHNVKCGESVREHKKIFLDDFISLDDV